MRPDFLTDKLWSLASQDVHLQRLFQRPEIKLRVPARTINLREIVLGKLARVHQRGGDDQRLDTKTWLLDTDSTFSDHQGLGKRLVGLPVDRTGLGRLEPGDNVIPLCASRFPRRKSALRCDVKRHTLSTPRIA